MQPTKAGLIPNNQIVSNASEIALGYNFPIAQKILNSEVKVLSRETSKRLKG